MRPLLPLLLLATIAAAAPLEFPVRTRTPTDAGLRVEDRPVRWAAEETALIICDFWDSHHCAGAVERVNDMAPRLAEVVEDARRRGVLIIHAPSDCMGHYEDHPARERARTAPAAANLPPDIDRWLHWKDEAEEKAGYPIDHSDGGCDDSPEKAAAWKLQLAAEGRDGQQWPWRCQHPAISIDPARDVISDRGPEIWNLLEARGIRHVLFTGVHTNMCVCGRPFGLRQLSRNGREVVLLRDLTDAMYNPERRPQVSHHRGTELMVAHIERFICPSALSSEVFGGEAHRFSGDDRPHLAVMIGEDEYRSGETVPAWAEERMGRRFRLSYLLAQEKDGPFSGMAALEDADVLLISVRRRALPGEQLSAVRRFIAGGGAVVGLRTASHAFALREGAAPAGRALWPEFDRDVLGGNYQGHHGAEAATTAEAVAEHFITEGLPRASFSTGGSLYRNSPLPEGSHVLVTGRAEGIHVPEPVAWVRTSASGGRVFYTSLGHPADFQNPHFVRLLERAVLWAAGREDAAR